MYKNLSRLELLKEEAMKKVVITGTSRGIGFVLAQEFANAGYEVLALSRNSKPLMDLHHPNIKPLTFDLAQEDSLKQVSNFIKEYWQSKVDIVIHNAGALINKPFTELTKEDFQWVYDVNVFGVAQLTQTLLPFMSLGSHVVIISSMGGIQGSMKFPGLAAYSSAKGAVITLAEVLAEEYKELGIAFNVLAIGAVQTEMLEEAFPGYQAPLTADQMAHYIFDFATTGNTYYNGKVLQVSSSTP